MTTLTTEALTADEIVTSSARKQVDAFNSGDWEQMRAWLAPDSATRAWNPAEDRGAREDPRALQGWKTAFPDAPAR